MNRYIKSYKGWKLVNEQSVIGAPNFGTFTPPSASSPAPIASGMAGAMTKVTNAVSPGSGANGETPSADGSNAETSSFRNSVPTKSYDDLRSGELDLNKEAFDAFSKYNNEVLTSDLLNSSNNYIKSIKSMPDGELKAFLIALSKGEGVNKDSAFKSFESGDWSLSPLSENGKETWIFDWVPIDSSFEKFKLKAVKSNKFSGRVSWFFTDNMIYPVTSKSDSAKKVTVNGFTNKSSTSKNTFKAGDTVYIKMHDESLRELTPDQLNSMNACSGLQYILKDWTKNTDENSELFKNNPDSIAIQRLRGPDTPVVPGYIILLERPNVGTVDKSNISKGGSDSFGEDYVGLII